MPRLMLVTAAAALIAGGVLGGGVRAQPGYSTSPAMRAALARFKTHAAAEDREADAAKASGGRWSGSTSAAPSGSLRAGQDLANPVRAALADACHQVAGAPVNSAHVRVDVGSPHPKVTCGLKSGRLVTVTFDADNNPRRAR
jgi:hypothetical protein